MQIVGNLYQCCLSCLLVNIIIVLAMYVDVVVVITRNMTLTNILNGTVCPVNIS